MKVVAVLFALLATAAAFAPAATNGRSSTAIFAKKKTPFFESVFGMDLFAPNPGVNNYGARSKKNLKTGAIGKNSYVPAGLSAQQYSKIRKNDASKQDKNYKKNVAKAGKYLDYTKFYTKRGTDTSDKWFKSAGRGHTFAKTKYDFSGNKDEQKNYDGSS